MGHDLPWSVPVRLEDIPETGQHIELAADEAIRAAVAAAARVPGVTRLVAAFDLTRRGEDGIHVTGTVSGTVQQVCSVTLEPMSSEVGETVDLTFLPAPSGAEPRAQAHSVEAGEEESETLIDGCVDLGAIATEFLILGIDPYPRKEGAAFARPASADSRSSPFEVLARLKK